MRHEILFYYYHLNGKQQLACVNILVFSMIDSNKTSAPEILRGTKILLLLIRATFMSFGMAELLLQCKLYGTAEIQWVLIPSQLFFSVLICNYLNCNYHYDDLIFI